MHLIVDSEVFCTCLENCYIAILKECEKYSKRHLLCYEKLVLVIVNTIMKDIQSKMQNRTSAFYEKLGHFEEIVNCIALLSRATLKGKKTQGETFLKRVFVGMLEQNDTTLMVEIMRKR